MPRGDYLLRRAHIKLALQSENEERELVRLYHDEKLSSVEISERLAQAGISITPRTIQRLVAKSGLIRSVGDAFRLAVERGRVHWAYKDPRFKAKRKKLSSELRYRVLSRDGFRCVKCGATAEKTILEVDHKIPVIQGGKSIESNLRTLCYECNQGKRLFFVER